MSWHFEGIPKGQTIVYFLAKFEEESQRNQGWADHDPPNIEAENSIDICEDEQIDSVSWDNIEYIFEGKLSDHAELDDP